MQCLFVLNYLTKIQIQQMFQVISVQLVLIKLPGTDNSMYSYFPTPSQNTDAIKLIPFDNHST